MEECLNYFRQAIERPGSVSPWAVWWAANEGKVRQAFPHEDYLRLKHRKLLGAATLLERTGWKAPEPPDPLRTGFCTVCGEPALDEIAGLGGGTLRCPNGCFATVYDCRPQLFQDE